MGSGSPKRTYRATLSVLLATRRPPMPVFCNGSCQDSAMRKRTAGPGRPNKGAREAFMTRLPEALATELRNEADELDLSYSELIGNIVAARYGLPPVGQPRPSGDQDQLAMP